MKKLPVALIFAFVFGISALAAAAVVEDYSNTIKEFRDSPVVAQFFNNCYGYAVFPTCMSCLSVDRNLPFSPGKSMTRVG